MTRNGVGNGPMAEQTLNIERMEHALSLFGSFDENIRQLEQHYQVSVLCRGTEIKISGDEEKVMLAARAVESL